MYASQLELHLARQAEVIRALEGAARSALAETRSLVAAGVEAEEASLDAHREAAARARRAVLDLIAAERLHVHLLVASSARGLVERLHEAALELDLAVTLGRADPLGEDALLRARAAVARDGRALLRALLHLTAHFRGPEATSEEAS